MSDAFFITAGELSEKGFDNCPDELVSSAHLIYSSPATLAFNSPGAQGFGVKRAGLAVPESVMLLVAPACCGRNTAMLSSMGYDERFFYLLLDETDIVTGRHLSKIPRAVKEICDHCEKKPSAVMICITCVDALLGTDMERVCRRCEEYADIPAIPCYMYALTREKRLPPMASVRKSVYSLLEPQKRYGDEINLLGFFSPLDDKCELYDLLHSAGIKTIREISRCRTFEEYRQLSRANFNLVLNTEARYASQEMEKKLGIPSIEISRLYRTEKIHNQYKLLGQATGVNFDDGKYLEETLEKADSFRNKFGRIRISVGECLNAEPFELALALTEYGSEVPEIFGTVTERNFIYIKKLAQVSPETKIYSNLSPTMIFYDSDNHADVCIGADARYYHPHTCGINFNEEVQPFGYYGVNRLFDMLGKALETEGKK